MTMVITMETTRTKMIVDIHTHVLPFMDDGSQSLEETLDMLKVMEASGINTVIATPHFDISRDDYTKFINKRDVSYKQVLKLIKDNDINIALEIGSELMYSQNLVNQNLNDLTLADTDYVLIELSPRREPLRLINTLEEIANQGFIVILAHVERYPHILEDSKKVRALHELGVLFQVNAKTVLSKEYENLFGALMKYHFIHFIASDAHDLDKRKPNLAPALMVIESQFGLSEQLKLTDNYTSLINNQIIDIQKPGKLKKIFNKYF